MVIDIKKYKNMHNNSYNNVLTNIENERKNNEWIDYVFPVIHGLNITKQNTYKFNNIIEAREFLNDKTLKRNTLEICRKIMKLNNIDYLNKKDKQKIHSSLTLFNYITDKNIKSLLKFRNYNEKLTSKFTYHREYSIFKKLLDKFYNGELEKTTLALIESEIYSYKDKEKILKNIKRKDIKKGEDVLIKFSEISSLVKENDNLKTTTKRQFYKNLNNEEIKIFNKFNISKKIKRLRDKTEKRIITSLLIITILSSSLLPVKVLAYQDIINQTKTLNNLTKFLETPKEEVVKNIDEYKEKERLAKEEIERKAKEEEERKRKEEQQRQKTYTTTIKYVEPTGDGNQDVINIAKSQVGNIGGESFWRWYGFNYRVEWCAIFVSWVAEQAGLIEKGTIPKFAAVSQGIKFYKDRGLWRDRSYSPRPGDLIFFDWNYNGIIDHVGIVEKVENDRVYTIEGNSNDICKEKNYSITSSSIYGYGTPNY